MAVPGLCLCECCLIIFVISSDVQPACIKSVKLESQTAQDCNTASKYPSLKPQTMQAHISTQYVIKLLA